MRRISELRQVAQRSTSNVYDALLTRRVSIYLTAVLHPLGVSPNVVSGLGLLVGLAACALLGGGRGAWLVVGAGLVHLYAVLDSVDGELARLGRRFSLRGLFLEDLSAYTMMNAFWLGVAAYLHRTTELLWPLAVAIGLCAFGRNAMPAARRAMMKSLHTRRPVDRPAPSSPAGPGRIQRLRAIVEDHILHPTYVWVVLSTLMVVEELAGVSAPLVLVGFSLVAAGYAAKELAIVAMFVTGRGLDRELDRIYRAAEAGPDDAADPARLASDRALS